MSQKSKTPREIREKESKVMKAVSEDDGVDGVILSAVPRSLSRRIFRGDPKTRGRFQDVSVCLYQNQEQTMSKSASTKGSFTITMSNYNDWSAYANEYDEVLFVRHVFDIYVRQSATNLLASTAGGNFSLAFDNLDSVTPSNPYDTSAARFGTGLRRLPPLIFPAASSATATCMNVWPPMMGQRSSTLQFSAIPPPYGKKVSKDDKRPVIPVALNQAACGNWFPTSTSALTVGYLKYFFDDLGTLGDVFVLGIDIKTYFKFRTRDMS